MLHESAAKICDPVAHTWLYRYTFPVGVVLHKPAVKHTVAMFSELSLAVGWQERVRRG